MSKLTCKRSIKPFYNTLFETSGRPANFLVGGGEGANITPVFAIPVVYQIFIE